MRLEQKHVCSLLDLAKEIKQDVSFYDMHMHPFELIYGSIYYEKNTACSHVYSADGSAYSAQKISDCDLNPDPEKEIPDAWRSRIFSMTAKKRYRHTGAKVFTDQMDMCGLDKSLLLPVALPDEPFMPQMAALAEMFGGNDRFLIAGSVPNDVSAEKMRWFIQMLVNYYTIKAVKIHPNVSQIEIRSDAGKEVMASVLSACGEFALPLIIHGGRSTVLKDNASGAYSEIDHLMEIEWGAGGSPVIIAHAGGYGCDEEEMAQHVLPILRRMMSAHDNLLVDISDLSLNFIELVLRNIDTGRILFGSDALYAPPWSIVVKLLYALRRGDYRVEDTFMDIISRNPEKFIFNTRNETASDAVSPLPSENHELWTAVR